MKSFYDKVEIQQGGCWIWYGARANDYGQLQFGGRVRGAHVVSYILHCDEVPNGMFVLHSCDNGFCVNPGHLFLGTQQDNMDDKVAKDRQAKGESNGRAVLTEIQVLEIRRLLDTNNMLQYEIAEQFNVDPKTITNIKHRRQWRHI